MTWLLATAAAHAADIVRGQQLYGQYCVACHGTNPAIDSPRLAAYNPSVLSFALVTQAQMFYLNGPLSDADIVDITEYIGSVVSPRVEPQTGWYWNAAESGRGFFIEKRDSLVFMAGFHYEADGRATWFTAQGEVDGSIMASPMYVFADGQTLTGPYRAPRAAMSPGMLAVAFTSATTSSLSWPGGPVSLVRFPFGAGGAQEAPQAGAPDSGWWWYAQESGRGFAIEFQGSSVYLCGFMYDDAGKPVWYVSGGAMTTPTSYRGVWWEFANGQAMGAAYRAPTMIDADPGMVELQFSDARNGTLTLPDGRRIPLTRFGF